MNLDRADVFSADATFVGDGSDDVSDFDSVAPADFDPVSIFAGCRRSELPIVALAARSVLAAARPPSKLAAIVLPTFTAIVSSIVAVELFSTGSILREERSTVLSDQCQRRGDGRHGCFGFLGELGDHVLEEFQIVTGCRSGVRDLLRETFDANRVDVVGGRRLNDLDRLLRRSLDESKFAALRIGQEDERFSLATSSSRSTDSMDVRVVVLRNVIVEDMADAGDVQAACGDVGRHQDVEQSSFQLLDRSFASLLRHVTVQGNSFLAFLVQLLGDRNGHVFRVRKDDHTVRLFDVEQTLQNVNLFSRLQNHRSLTN